MRIGIIGAGIGGLTAGILLQQAGHQVMIYEARRRVFDGAGIGIGSNALKALRQAGVAEAVQAAGNVLKEVQFRTEHDTLLNRLILSVTEFDNVTLLRSSLYQILLQAYHDKVQWNTRAEVRDNRIVIDGNEEVYDLIIAADGARSSVRKQLFGVEPIYQGYTCFRGISSNEGILQHDTTMEYWGKSGRIGIVPLADNQLYWFICINAREGERKYKHYQIKDLQHHFAAYPALVKAVLNCSDEAVLHHDIYDIEPLDTFYKGRIVLLGDAAHATTPNMGQGAGQSIEDALCLVNQLKKYPVDEALQAYSELSVPHTKKVILKSRQIGKAAQYDNQLKIALRNKAFKFVPESVLEKQTFFLNHRPVN